MFVQIFEFFVGGNFLTPVGGSLGPTARWCHKYPTSDAEREYMYVLQVPFEEAINGQ